MNDLQAPEFDINSIPLEFNPLFGLDENPRQNDNSGDDKLFLKFFTKAVLHPAESTKAGRPIYKDQDFVEIRIPGSQLTSIITPIKHSMSRFGDRYKMWKAGQAETMTGTPLENFPLMFNKPSLVAELNALNIKTVEQLANIPDNTKQRIMGGHELSRRAATWIEATTGADAKIEQMAGENAAMRQQMEELQARLAAMEGANSIPAASKAAGVVAKEK